MTSEKNFRSIAPLAWITVGLTYVLMTWGNVVSATGSGLACPDWPLCHGTITPPARFEIILEWGHRTIAAITTLFIFATVFMVLKRKSQNPALSRSGKSLLALLGIQILLGGTTVLLELSVAVSTIHLVIASLVFGGLITVACTGTWGSQVALPSSAAVDKVKRLALSGLVTILIQFVLGALVRHGHAGLACPAFPSCSDVSFLPMPWMFETTVAFLHRWWGIAMLGLFVHLAVASSKTSPTLGRPARLIAALGFVQVVLGIGTVLTGLHTHTRATHAALGYALWGLLFYTALRAGGLKSLWTPTPSDGASGRISSAAQSAT